MNWLQWLLLLLLLLLLSDDLSPAKHLLVPDAIWPLLPLLKCCSRHTLTSAA